MKCDFEYCGFAVSGGWVMIYLFPACLLVSGSGGQSCICETGGGNVRTDKTISKRPGAEQ